MTHRALMASVGATALLTAGLVTTVSSIAAAREIGTVAATNREIEGTPPNTPSRVLEISDPLIQDERIVSSPIGQGQFIFLDQTTLSVSPNSQLVLDNYVYDPDQQTGEMALSLTKGVLRFIGGRITKTNRATIQTPTATIGIRGGIGIVRVREDRSTQVLHVAGRSTEVISGGSTLVLSRSSALAEVPAPVGGVPQPPVFVGVASSEDVGSFFTPSSSTTESDEVAEPEAIETGVTSLGELNSGDPEQPFRPAISTEGESATPPKEDGEEVTSVVTDPDISGPEADELPEVIEPAVPPAVILTNAVGGFSIGPTVGTTVTGTFGDDVVSTGGSLATFGPVQTFDSFVAGSVIGISEDDESIVTEVTFNVPDLGTGNYSTIGDAEFAISSFTDIGASFTGVGINDSAESFEGVIGTYDDGTNEFPVLAVYGIPTPDQLNVFTGDDLTIREYQLLEDPIQQADLAFAHADVADVFEGAVFQRMTMIPQPNDFLYGTDQQPVDNVSSMAFAQMAIVGEGIGQSTFIGTTTGNLNDEMPAYNGGVAGGPVIEGFGRSNFSLGGGEDETGRHYFNFRTPLDIGATLFGEDGKYFFLSNSGPSFGAVRVPEFDLNGVGPTFGGQSTALIPDETYVTQHLAVLDDVYVVSGTDRGNIGTTTAEANAFYALPETSTNQTIDAGEYDRVTTGGFAAVTGADFSTVTSEVEQFVAASSKDTGVRMAFNAETSAIGAALSLDIFDIADLDLEQQILIGFGGNSFRSSYLDDDEFLMEETFGPTDNVMPNGAVTSIGSDTGRDPNSIGRQQAFRGGIVSTGYIGNVLDFPTGTNTTPNYLTWGWWHGDFVRNDGATGGFRTNFHLGSWVTGVVSEVSTLPNTGSASFDGFTVAHVDAENGFTFVDGGKFTMNYDFGTSTGTASLREFSELPDIQIGVSGTSVAGMHFNGAVDNLNTQMTMTGSFFDSDTGLPAKAVAGSYAGEVSNGSTLSNASVTGIFGGQSVSP